ncbi:MAG: pilus assembly protein PilM [Planctomycetes bacterium]|nr:pilus assembly protein PilM [Planctomycetota bacterium]
MPIGLDIGSHAIKALAVRRVGGKFQVIGATRVRRASVESDEARFPVLTKELYTLFATARVSARECVVGLTGRDLNLRFVQLPPVQGKGDLRQMIGFEVTQIIGRGGAEIYSDYAVLDVEEKYPEISLLLAMAKRSLAEDFYRTCIRAGLGVKDLTPNAIGLFTAYRNAGSARPGEVTMLLDIGAENTDLVLVRDGQLLFARNISTGAKVFTDTIQGALKCSASKAEDRKIRDGSLVRGEAEAPGAADIRGLLFNAVGPLQSTVHSSMQFARAQMKLDLEVGRILLSGGGARLRGFPEYLSSVLGKSVERFNPFGGVDLSRLSPATAAELSSTPTDFAVALGLAQLGSEASPATALSLLPDSEKKTRSFWKQGLWLAGAAASALKSRLRPRSTPGWTPGGRISSPAPPRPRRGPRNGTPGAPASPR